MKKKLIAVLMAAAMTVSLTACGSADDAAKSGSGTQGSESGQSSADEGEDGESSTDGQDSKPDDAPDAGKVYHVGICQLVEHEALDSATKGFKDSLTELLGEDGVKFDEQNAQNEQTNCATICNGFVANNVDLILANATPALQAASAATNQIPILGTSVTDYATALGMSEFDGTTRHKYFRHQ